MIRKFYPINSLSWLILAALVTLVAGVFVSIDLSHNSDLLLYNFTQWVFTYDYGFGKRALVGELLSYWVAPEQLLPTVQLVTILVTVLVGSVLILLFLRPFLRTGDPGLMAYAILAITHPATLQHLFYDQGRFDHLGLLLMILCLVVIRRGGTGSSIFAVLTGGVIGVLIHEVFFALFFPLVLMYWFMRQPAVPFVRLSQAVVVFAVLGVTLFLMLGSALPLTQDAYVASLRSLHGDWISEKSVQVLYGGIGVESRRALDLLLSPRRLLQYMILGVFLLPTIVFVYGVIRRHAVLVGGRREAQEPGLWLMVVAGLSPLAVLVVGIDFARWWSLALTNMLIALALCVQQSERFRNAVAYAFSARPWLIWTALASHLLSGPLGVAASAFPRIEPYIQSIYSAIKQTSQ